LLACLPIDFPEEERGGKKVLKKKNQTKPNQSKPYKTNKNERHCTTTVHIATRCNVASEATQRGKLGTDPEASRGKL
jgi:hypothetical protein